MIVQLQTIFNAPLTIYDSEAPDTGPSFLKTFFHPVVQVQQGNITLYKTEEFYQDNSMTNILIALSVLLGIGYGAARLLK